ncbi:MAG: thioredoxin-disulfide reductase [Candidatus Levybacteria bacterium]|nr:thioredoxin-disulfide reductase [Candidatus Levybacteria bacterium]
MYDVVIIGSGPAGLTAAIYTTRANLKTLVIAGDRWGGQLMLTSLVENYPGFPEGIQGPDLMMNMRKQAEHHGAEILDSAFTKGDFTRLPSPDGEANGGQAKQPFKIWAGEKEYQAKSVIIASGADARWLNVPGEKEKIGRGVSSCATCDAAFFRKKVVIVVGGGDSAMEESLVLSRVATQVTLIHRRDSFRASQIMQDRVKETPNIKILFNSEITEVQGEMKVEKVKIKNIPSGEVTEMPVDGVFVAIGHIPNTKVFEGIDLDEQGYVKVANHYHTNVEGVFVAGDVHDRAYRQAVTAAGFGSAAALEAERWLAKQAK